MGPSPRSYVPTTSAKPVWALKPNKLSVDTNLGSVEHCNQRLRAFHSLSNLRVLPLTDQEVFLIACIYNKVPNQINRIVSETTPLFPNQAGVPCCFNVINTLYSEKLLRLVQFMSYKQH